MLLRCIQAIPLKKNFIMKKITFILFIILQSLLANSQNIPEAIGGFQWPLAGTLNGNPGFTNNGGYSFLQSSYYPSSCNWMYHPAQDWNVVGTSCDQDANSNIYAIATGKVICISTGWGSMVIQHNYKGQTYFSQYGHSTRITGLTVGSIVTKGQHIGYLNDIGTGCAHLHMEIRDYDHPNPSNCNYWDCSVLKNYNSVNNYYKDAAIFIPNNQHYGPSLTSPNNNAVLNQNNVLFDWNDISGAINYRIQISSNPSGFTPQNGFTTGIISNSTTGSNSNFTTNLAPGVYYWTVKGATNFESSIYCSYRVLTINGNTCSSPSNVIHTNITATSARINWDYSPYNTSSFSIESPQFGNINNIPNTYYYKDIFNLQPGTSYSYRMKRICSNGSYTYSPYYFFTTAQGCSAPSNVNLSNISSFGTKVAWTPGNISNTNNFTIEINGPGYYNAYTVPNSYTYYEINGLSPNITYSVRVRRNCITGGSTYSPSLSFTTINNNLSDGVYRITRQGTNVVVDVSGCGSTAGSNVQLWSFNGYNCQQWFFQKQSDGTYEIKRQGTALNLDASGCGSTAGSNVHLWSDNNLNCQRWLLDKQSDGTYEIKRQGTNLNLDASGCGTNPGTNVQLWSDNNLNCQRWILTYVGGSAANEGEIVNRDTDKDFEQHYLDIAIAPNPASDQIVISLGSGMIEHFMGNKIDVSIYDINGRKVHVISSLPIENIPIDISHLAPGIYYAMIQGTMVSKKFVVIQ